MVELMSIDVGDGSSLVLGVRGERPEPETNVSLDAELFFQHRRPAGPDEPELWPLTEPGFNSCVPVIVNGRSHIVFAGEVDSCIDAVLLRFATGDEPPYHEYMARVAEPLGRRIWMTHPQPYRAGLRVWVAWLHGQPAQITIAGGSTTYGA